MARRRSEIPLVKKTLNLGVGDFEAMGALFPAMGGSNAIRILVHNYVRKVRESLAPVDIAGLDDFQLEELMTEPGELFPTKAKGA